MRALRVAMLFADAVPPILGYRAAVVSDSPLAYWRMGDRVGSKTAAGEVADIDAFVVPEPPTPGPAFNKKGLFDTSGSVMFDGQQGHYLQVNGLTPVGTTFTFETWIFLETVPTDYRNIAYTSSTTLAYGVYMNGTAGFGCSRVDAIQKTSVQTNTVPSVNTWHHVVATMAGTTPKLYVDGEPTGTSDTSGDIPGAGGSLYLGAKDPTAGSLLAGTRLTEVAVYGSALSPERIKEHYRLGKL